MRELSKPPQVYVKVSEVMRLEDEKPSTDHKLYTPTPDYLFDTFGEDRLIFRSDWPKAAAVDNLPAIVKIVRDYFEVKGRAAAEKHFWRNSVVAYTWMRREPDQPGH